MLSRFQVGRFFPLFLYNFRIAQLPQAFKGGFDQVVRIVRSNRLGQNILNPRQFHNRSNNRARDNSCPFRGWPQQDLPGAVLPYNLVRFPRSMRMVTAMEGVDNDR